MQPRSDEVGVILSADETIQARQFHATAWNNWILGAPLGKGRSAAVFPESQEDGTVVLDVVSVKALDDCIGKALGVHRDNYRSVSNQHQYHAEKMNLAHRSTQAHLLSLERQLEQEAQKSLRATALRELLSLTVRQSVEIVYGAVQEVVIESPDNSL